MNRLEIVKRLRQEAGVAGNGPVTTINQQGELKRLVDWVDDAWKELQGLQLWDWLWLELSPTIPAGESKVAGTLPADRIDRTAMYLAGRSCPLPYMAWQEFREACRQLPVGAPTCWTVRPDLSIAVNAIAPAGGTALQGEGWARPTAMTVDGDVPALPEERHMAIVWLALQKYAAFEEAGVLYQTAEREYRKLMLQELDESTPALQLGGPLC